MEREILFRGKDKATNQWVYGDYTHNEGLNTHYISRNVNNTSRKAWEVDPDTIGQYTGLTDKEGNKIFEGDILSGQNCRFVVKYDERQAEFVAVNSTLPKGFGLPMSQTWIDETNKTICGNIHDNPELIK